MATSPLFGWQEPDDTSLVKDGAAAIRTLGNAIDTSMGDLLGGTTGQVLAKASNTNMDFTWVAQDDSNAIQNAIVDAKGDLIAASAADTPARLAVGANGETLVADSSTSTGLRYQGTQSAGKNAVINGGFDIWQRGTSFAASGAEYTADRWQKWTSSTNFTVTRQASGLTGILYCSRFQRNVGTTGTAGYDYWNTLESQDSYRFAGQTVTLSFYARAGANYSAASSGLAVKLFSGTGTDQNVNVGGFTGAVALINNSAILTTSWQRFTFTATVGSTATQLGIVFQYVPTGTAGANDYYEVTGVQLELGSVATNFLRTGGTIQGELAACQRYLPSIQGSSSDFATGQCYATTNTLIVIPFPVTARVAPTGVTVNSAGNFRLRNATSGLLTCTTVAFSSASTYSGSVDAVVASGLVAGNATNLYNAASGTILFTGCEL